MKDYLEQEMIFLKRMEKKLPKRFDCPDCLDLMKKMDEDDVTCATCNGERGYNQAIADMIAHFKEKMSL